MPTAPRLEAITARGRARRRRRLAGEDSQDREISFRLIKAGGPLTCTSMPDHGPHGDD